MAKKSLAEMFNAGEKLDKRERSVERYLIRRIRDLGGACYKFNCPGHSGVPDRIVIYNGKVAFLEVKRPGGRPRHLQQCMMEELRSLGVLVDVVDSKDEIDRFLGKLLR